MTFISFVHSALWTKGIGDKQFVHVVLLTQFLFSIYGYESKLIDSFIFLFFWRGGVMFVSCGVSGKYSGVKSFMIVCLLSQFLEFE